MMTKYFLDEEKIISGHFESGQIEHYIKELGSRLEAIIYLWAFNNFSVHYPNDLEDLGRPMYRKLAKKLSKILCIKENAENFTQNDLSKIDDMQHDKAAYKALCEKWLRQRAEINRLREEKSEIEIELKNTEQTCYGWQRLVESLEEQNNQLKAGNDKLREAINSALNFMACPDDLSELTGKCNDQAAFDVLREALNNEREG